MANFAMPLSGLIQLTKAPAELRGGTSESGASDAARPVALDWEQLALQLLDDELRPRAVLDARGGVRAMNHALEQLLMPSVGDEGFRGQLQSASLWKFDLAVRQAKNQGEARAELSLERSERRFTLSTTLKRLGSAGQTAALLLTVTEVKLEQVPEPLEPVVGFTYEVEVDAQGPTGRVLKESGPGPDDATAALPCWKRLHGRETACEACPVRALVAQPDLQTSSAALPGAGAQFSALLAVAKRRRPDAVAVTTVPIVESTLSELILARAAHLAERAGLTAREREVLSLLLLGRSPGEVAQVTGMSPRTAKFHQQNLLTKLGADSRNDLLRLLM